MFEFDYCTSKFVGVPLCKNLASHEQKLYHFLKIILHERKAIHQPPAQVSYKTFQPLCRGLLQLNTEVEMSCKKLVPVFGELSFVNVLFPA